MVLDRLCPRSTGERAQEKYPVVPLGVHDWLRWELVP